MINLAFWPLLVFSVYMSLCPCLCGKQNDGLVHDCGISSANAPEIPQSCTKPLKWQYYQSTLKLFLTKMLMGTIMLKDVSYVCYYLISRKKYNIYLACTKHLDKYVLYPPQMVSTHISFLIQHSNNNDIFQYSADFQLPAVIYWDPQWSWQCHILVTMATVPWSQEPSTDKR